MCTLPKFSLRGENDAKATLGVIEKNRCLTDMSVDAVQTRPLACENLHLGQVNAAVYAG